MTKRIIYPAIIFAAIIFAAMIIGAAKYNYSKALQAAQACEGSDQAICEIMAAHGFDVTAMETQPPTIWQQVAALFSQRQGMY